MMKLPNKPKVLAATYNPISKTKMFSVLVDFPTVLLAELRTHRILTQGSLYEHSELVDFNLSANSARAIPHNKYLKKVEDNPFVPIWTANQKGMRGEPLKDEWYVNQVWSDSLIETKWKYEILIKEGVHKQNANRLLSPFAYTTCIISGTEWDNFFFLRLGKDAQPEFREVAILLKKLYDNANWKESKYHIPFEDELIKLYADEIIENGWINDNPRDYADLLMKISASMCAKLSYNTQDNEDTLEKHLERADMLIESKHQEPFSHQAIAMDEQEYSYFFKSRLVVDKDSKQKHPVIDYGWCYNLKGFISNRYILENF